MRRALRNVATESDGFQIFSRKTSSQQKTYFGGRSPSSHRTAVSDFKGSGGSHM
jgi:hypothetical protein